MFAPDFFNPSTLKMQVKIRLSISRPCQEPRMVVLRYMDPIINNRKNAQTPSVLFFGLAVLIFFARVYAGAVFFHFAVEIHMYN